MSEHKLFILAGGIAFNILLYIIPLVLILVLFVNVFIKPDDLISLIEGGINRYLPGVENYTQIITSVVAEVNSIANSSKIFGIVGFIILLWISSTVISTLNTCITHIFNVEQPHYFKTKLKDLATTILLNVLIILYGVLLPVFSFAASFINSVTPDIISIWLSKAIVILTNVVISGLFFYFIYWIVPSSKTKMIHRISVHATLIAVFATEVARFLFTWYISTISNYSKFYGTYAVIVTMAIWLFYSCFIILFSAELSKYLWDLKEKRELQIAEDTRSIIEKYRYKQKLKKQKRKKGKKYA
jgi:membrane protein